VLYAVNIRVIEENWWHTGLGWVTGRRDTLTSTLSIRQRIVRIFRPPRCRSYDPPRLIIAITFLRSPLGFLEIIHAHPCWQVKIPSR
jgi:hypothetical protein